MAIFRDETTDDARPTSPGSNGTDDNDTDFDDIEIPPPPPTSRGGTTRWSPLCSNRASPPEFVELTVGFPDKAAGLYEIPEHSEAWTAMAIGYMAAPAKLPDAL